MGGRFIIIIITTVIIIIIVVAVIIIIINSLLNWSQFFLVIEFLTIASVLG